MTKHLKFWVATYAVIAFIAWDWFPFPEMDIVVRCFTAVTSLMCWGLLMVKPEDFEL
jgi:hypothetical protein